MAGNNKVRKNWAKIKRGFCDFNIIKPSKTRAAELLKEPSVIKNRRRIEAIILNAEEFQRIIKEYCSFQNFLRSLKAMGDREVLKALAKRFRYIGDYTAEYYLHSVGHLE